MNQEIREKEPLKRTYKMEMLKKQAVEYPHITHRRLCPCEGCLVKVKILDDLIYSFTIIREIFMWKCNDNCDLFTSSCDNSEKSIFSSSITTKQFPYSYLRIKVWPLYGHLYVE